MITRRVRLQLLVFVIITLLGVSFVGARYAQLDRLVVSRTYNVTAEFTDSGGIFADAEVTYRGVGVGRVKKLEFTDKGVRATMAINNDAPMIPADSKAVVADKSAVGEQFIDLQPQGDAGPYLKSGSNISMAHTDIPIATTKLLVDVNALVNSVDKRDLKVVVDELGSAFQGTGRDLAKIIDTSNAFLTTADDNFNVTSSLIKNTSGVLQTQIDGKSDLQTFAKNLSALSDTLVDSDKDLRTILDKGPGAASDLRQVITENADDLGTLLNNVLTTNKILVANIDGVRGLLIIYPYAVEGGFTVATKDSNGLYEAHFGLVPLGSPSPCKKGYHKRRPPNDLTDRPLDVTVKCDLPPSEAVPRAAKNAHYQRPPVVGVYDEATKTLKPTTARRSDFVVPDSQAFGKDSWKWLLLGPIAAK